MFLYTYKSDVSVCKKELKTYELKKEGTIYENNNNLWKYEICSRNDGNI